MAGDPRKDKKKEKKDAGPREKPAPDQRYFEATRQPAYSFWLVLPFAFVYLVGTVFHQAANEPFQLNYADSIIKVIAREIWDSRGLDRYFPSTLSALVLVAFFGCWQAYKKTSWRVEPGSLGLMLTECLLFAVCLQVLHLLIDAPRTPLPRGGAGHASLALVQWAGAAPPGFSGNLWKDMVIACGAGVFEELVFRVFLVGLITLFLWRVGGLDKKGALCVAVCLGAFVFTLAHYQPLNQYMGPMRPAEVSFWRGFAFRYIAGVMLGFLCYLRSFGVAVGSHALYDILVVLQDHIRDSA